LPFYKHDLSVTDRQTDGCNCCIS